MSGPFSSALQGYAPAFQSPEQPFLNYYPVGTHQKTALVHFTRGRFWSLAKKAAFVIRAHGCEPGDAVAHCFGSNHYHDLAFRLAATMTGTIPITINWQADTLDRILYKIEATGSRLAITRTPFDRKHIRSLGERFPALPVYDTEPLEKETELPEEEFSRDGGAESTRIIVFTSGTTGLPKGVRLPYRAYETNRATFEQFLDVRPEHNFAVLVVNPFHHTNSTAITDWAMRRPGSHIHLVERYSTIYWKLVRDTAGPHYDRLVAPTVSRHFDFLETLDREGRLPVGLDDLKRAMARTDFLIGSAPVGPTTIQRLIRYAGRIPHVRFGSTETCLQAIGTPRYLSEQTRMRAFEKGWGHRMNGEPQPGYYIGRPHPPHTEARVVRSVTPGHDEFLVDCLPGHTGYLITRGRNLMSGYVGDLEATDAVFQKGWYTGLKDICFTLENEEDGQQDFYWVSRESTLLIRGGANYAYDQINSELSDFLSRHYHLEPNAFDLAVVALRADSEHEDSCCVTIQLVTPEAEARREEIKKTFKALAAGQVSKGAKPDYVRFDTIPKNFKGSILVNELADQFRKYLDLRQGNPAGDEHGTI
jgi:acyl-CoA synthetase (AMP-forming)/AMP-acid ligase II